MSKATTKQVLKVLSVLQDNLPKEEIENFENDIAQAIIENGITAGREFMRFLKNSAHVHVVGNHIINCSSDPFMPPEWKKNGWTVEEHQKTGDLVWDPSKITLYLSDKQKNGGVISGKELRTELKGKPVLNANILDYLLAHPELIPEELKDKTTFFWGTIYRDSDGRLYVRCLAWGGKRWNWYCIWLGGGWGDNDSAAVSAGV